MIDTTFCPSGLKESKIEPRQLWGIMHELRKLKRRNGCRIERWPEDEPWLIEVTSRRNGEPVLIMRAEHLDGGWKVKYDPSILVLNL